MPSKKNEVMLQEVLESLDNSNGLFVIDYRGLTVKEAQSLRRKLTDAQAHMKVYKNNIVKLALAEKDMPNLDHILAGTTACVFYEIDPVEAAKVIKLTSKELNKIEFKGGISDGQAIDADQALAIADLPSREELVARFAAAGRPARAVRPRAQRPGPGSRHGAPRHRGPEERAEGRVDAVSRRGIAAPAFPARGRIRPPTRKKEHSNGCHQG